MNFIIIISLIGGAIRCQASAAHHATRTGAGAPCPMIANHAAIAMPVGRVVAVGAVLTSYEMR